MQCVCLDDYDRSVPEYVADTIAMWNIVATSHAVKGQRYTVDLGQQITREILPRLNEGVLHSLREGDLVGATLGMDMAKSVCFHGEIEGLHLRRYLERNPASVDLSNFNMTAIIYPEKVTLTSFLRAKSAIVVNYYIIDDRLIVTALGKRDGRAVVFVPDVPSKLCTTYKTILASFSKIATGHPSAFYYQHQQEVDRLLFELALTQGSVLKQILSFADHADHLYLIPYSFLHSLPLHLSFEHTGNDVFEFFQGIHYLPSLAMAIHKSHSDSAGSHALAFFMSKNISLADSEREFIEVLTDSKAPGQAVLRETKKDWTAIDSSSRLLHFSCHGASSPNDWRESRLSLSDGDLTAVDIMDSLKPLYAQITVLSACETGMFFDSAKSVDYYAGLDMAFWLAGSHAVLSTAWSVRSDCALVFNMLFYHALFVERHPTSKAYVLAVRFLRTGAWKLIVQERLEAMRQGQWPRSRCVHLRPTLEGLMGQSDSIFSNVLFWAPFKYMGL
jgi:CHAT domain-containing protein